MNTVERDKTQFLRYGGTRMMVVLFVGEIQERAGRSGYERRRLDFVRFSLYANE